MKLDYLLTSNERYRELCSWRKDFKKTWRNLETREITMPLNDAYRPDAKKWLCTCPFFVTSRFLICKHLVQRVHRVDPVFFLKAKRYRSVPFWRDEGLKLLDEAHHEGDESLTAIGPNTADEDDEDDDIPNGEEEDEFVDDETFFQKVEDGKTFSEALSDDIDLITEFLAGVKFQMQFRDQRFLNMLEKEGAGFFRLAKLCLEREKRLKRQVSDPASTWDKSTISSMFYRARPIHDEELT
jgi:hypothetical protein